MSSKKLEVRLNRQGHEMPYNLSIVGAIDMPEIYSNVDGGVSMILWNGNLVAEL